MEDDRSAFNRALSGMVTETAYRRAIRHLFDSGLDEKEIEKALTYPVSPEVIRRELEAYRKEKEDEESSGERVEYVAVTDRYGRTSYIRKSTGKA